MQFKIGLEVPFYGTFVNWVIKIFSKFTKSRVAFLGILANWVITIFRKFAKNGAPTNELGKMEINKGLNMFLVPIK
jgi:hypothetical protein